MSTSKHFEVDHKWRTWEGDFQKLLKMIFFFQYQANHRYEKHFII